MPPGIESKILGGNNYQSDYTRQTEIFRNNILRTFVTPQFGQVMKNPTRMLQNTLTIQLLLDLLLMWPMTR